MKASALIGRDLVHATDAAISGRVTDLLFDLSLQEVVFFLVEITAEAGTASLLFSPVVMELDDGVIKTNAHPDDIAHRVNAAVHRTSVAIDPTDLPSTLIGPFGNTISPSLIAALFNARTAEERPKPPGDSDGVWFTLLKGHAVRAHVGDVGHLADIHLDDHLTATQNVEIATAEGAATRVAPSNIHAKRSADDTLVLTISQDQAGA